MHVNEFGWLVERWQFSDTDVRWYRLETWNGAKWVTIKGKSKVPS